MKSTDKIEKILHDVEHAQQPALPLDRLQHFKRLRRSAGLTSAWYLILTFMTLMGVYGSIIQSEYTLTIIEAILFIICLYNMLETYFITKVYSNIITGRVEIHLEKKDGKV